MPKQETLLYAFNRGIASRLALARVDLKRLAISAEEMINWMPRVMGSMMLRAGLQYTGATASNAASRSIPFVRSSTTKARLEFTNLLMRVWIDDALVTRASVSTAVTNGTFLTDITGWTDNDDSGATSAWVTGGYMGLTGDGTNFAIRDQTVTVAAPDQNVEHALRITVLRGPVQFQVGTGTTNDSYVSLTELNTGVHSLAFTPTGNFNIRFKSSLKRIVLVDSVAVEAAGVMTIPTPYATADLDNIRADPQISQSVDVMFVACENYTQRKVERRAARSWSVCLYLANDGPFRSENAGPITITPSALSGNVTLTASAALFKSTQAPSTNNAGALFRITSAGQHVTSAIAAQNTFTNAIEVDGVGSQRYFTLTITGTFVATVTLQQSLVSESGPWTDTAVTRTAPTTEVIDDTLSNTIAWYRAGIKAGAYTSGTATVSIDYNTGSTDGVVRITDYTSATSVAAEVITDLGALTASDTWAEGEWSDYRGWPTSGGFFESRLVWAGKDKIQISVSDAFEVFDPNTEGDSGPISRSIGSGPLDVINWVLPLQRIILGGDMAEHSCKSNTFEEPITPTNFNIKPASTQGSAKVQAARIDNRGMMIQRGGTRMFELDLDDRGVDYGSVDTTLIVPEILKPMAVRIGVQRQPDTRVHCVRSDGTAAVLVNDKRENVMAWIEIETDGLIEDVCVLPSSSGEDEDRVYYTVARTINGSTVRYHEKFALESECVGGTLNKQADAFVVFTNAPASATITGLSHLIGESVVVWADGKCLTDAAGDIATFTVNGSGQITATNGGASYSATTGIVGLPYTADFLSAKLGQMLTHHKKVDKVGLILADTHAKGLQIGPSLTGTMDYLPLVHEGAVVDEDEVYTDYDQESQEFPGDWSTDARLAMKAEAPRPCTVLAALIEGTVN